MKAVVCREYGPPESLALEETSPPSVGSHDVKIAVHACGVNFPDLLMIEGKYQFKPPFPFSPGAEVAGEVIEVGPEVSGVKPGARVMAMVGHGGFAEEVVTDASRVMALPETMDYATAAGFTMTYGTSYYALVHRANLKPGETLVVHGAAGGVGLTAVEIGRLLGARVIGTGGNDEKLKTVLEYGAEHVINYRNEKIRDAVKALTNNQGADVIYDPVGGDVFDESLRCVNWGGRILVIGFTSGRIAEARTNLILLKGCSVVGVFWGSFVARDPEQNQKNFDRLFRWYEEGKLRPHIHKTVPLEEAVEALQALANREVVGKMIVTPGSS